MEKSDRRHKKKQIDYLSNSKVNGLEKQYYTKYIQAPIVKAITFPDICKLKIKLRKLKKQISA